MKTSDSSAHTKLSVLGVVVTLGIVFGDIGTSPLYVMKAILSWSQGGITPDFILGALSCIIWTLTLQTTLKYVLITLRADNRGEGGILALYALVRKNKKKWIYLVAILGASTLIADGIITPSITVLSAVEGLAIINPSTPIIPIVLIILVLLFVIQQFGTHSIGKYYGPIMFVWFLVLGLFGLIQVIQFPMIVKAINPWYAVKLLTLHPTGFLILGAVFLCTTGAEALYSDLGHCGKQNIRISWIFVKITLVLNYLGQGAWILNHPNLNIITTNPFFAILPQQFIVLSVALATAAAIIASQALISGSFTILSEAMSLNFWPRQHIKYPTEVKGQLYIPFVNWFLLIACVFVVLFFQTSSAMEAAYGLSITITMLMTTLLLMVYLQQKKVPIIFIALFLCMYIPIEGSFLLANLFKFFHGGWLTILLAGIIGVIMYVWFKGRKMKNSYLDFFKTEKYYEIITDIKNDESIPKYATNLVFLSKADNPDEVESKVVYSMINKHPKRAEHYWLLHVDYVDDPYTFQYSYNPLIPGTLYRLEFRLGFKIQPLINLYFRQVIEDLVKNKEFDLTSHYPSLAKHHITGDFKFIIIHRVHNYDFEFSFKDKIVMKLCHLISFIGINDIKSLGLDTSNVVLEKVPLIVRQSFKAPIQRVELLA